MMQEIQDSNFTPQGQLKGQPTPSSANVMRTRKRNPVVFFVVALIIVLIFAGGVFVLRSGKNSQGSTATPSVTSFLPPADPNIKVDLKPINEGRIVILSLADIPGDTISIEYELTYVTENGLPKGVLGTTKLEPGQKSVEREITLGTCSSGKCVYDENVEKVTVTLKFNTSSGASRFQKEYNIK